VKNRILLISGMSGAGKSSALRAFEDVGYYCIDNLPPPLVNTFVELCERAGTGIMDHAALAIDVRTGGFLDDFARAWQELQSRDAGARLLFFDADDPTLLQRFSETRRPHPLGAPGGVAESIRAERRLLEPIRELADDVIDTSEYNVRTLRDFLLRHFGAEERQSLSITLTSFGFRHGVPHNADLVFDVRFLPNPYYDLELRPQSGLDAPVKAFVEGQPATKQFLEHVESLLAFLLPEYAAEGKTYLTVAFGCTGGRHRSVAMVGKVNEILTQRGYSTTVLHADLDGPNRGQRR
jgi:UPF0042 nucleotide-binding protein